VLRTDKEFHLTKRSLGGSNFGVMTEAASVPVRDIDNKQADKRKSIGAPYAIRNHLAIAIRIGSYTPIISKNNRVF
jgi:hypothetical protein